MWMKRSLSILLAVLVVALAAGAMLASRPAAWRVSRTATLAAPAAVLVAELVDLRRWGGWWSGAGLDEEAPRTFGGPATGVGATCYWAAAGRAGQGRLTVVGAAPGKVELEQELHLESPEPASRDLEFTLETDGAATRVTAAVTGEDALARRALSLLWSRDDELGPELERALAGLGRVAEAVARSQPRRLERAARIAAPPELVMAELADLRRWGDWVPWEAPGRELTWTFGGPLQGAGASAYWSGDAADGRGRLTVLKVAHDRVQVEREVESPRPGSSDHEFRVSDDEGGTLVTWAVASEREPGDLAEGWAPDAEARLASELERGLARLKDVVERDASAAP
jgi:hypothetical protein